MNYYSPENRKLKPNTSHVFTNFINILIPYLIDMYTKHFKCRNSDMKFKKIERNYALRLNDVDYNYVMGIF